MEGNNLAPVASSSTLPRGRRSRDKGSFAKDRNLGRIHNIASGNVSPERVTEHNQRRVRTKRHTDSDAYKTSDEEEEVTPIIVSKIPSLDKDISITMRKRAVEGYGLDPIRNRRMVKEGGLHELWSWIDHAATTSAGGRAFVNDYDFGFKGVLAILRGFPPYESATSPLHTPDVAAGPQSKKGAAAAANRRNRTVSQQTGAGGVIDDVRSSIKRGDANRAQEIAFAKACAAMNKKNGVTPFTISSRPAQRQLALASIGPDFANGDVASVIRRYEHHNQPEKAAAWALFSGNIEMAIRSLKSNKGAKWTGAVRRESH